MTQASLLDDPNLEQRILDQARSSMAAERGVKKAAGKLASPLGAAWQLGAIQALMRVASRQQSLTTDDVWKELGEVDARYASQMGLVVRFAKKEQLIASTGGFVESARPSRHRCALRVWRSLLCQA